MLMAGRFKIALSNHLERNVIFGSEVFLVYLLDSLSACKIYFIQLIGLMLVNKIIWVSALAHVAQLAGCHPAD